MSIFYTTLSLHFRKTQRLGCNGGAMLRPAGAMAPAIGFFFFFKKKKIIL
jgi:hypothetical protein